MRKCEICGAVDNKNWMGEIEYSNGRRYHFRNPDRWVGIMPILCDGEMRPIDDKGGPTTGTPAL